MIFNSFTFAAFLPVVLAVYFCLRTKPQNLWLLGASYFFYGWWDWRFLSLLATSTLIDFFVSHRIERSKCPKARRRFLAISIATNLGILGFFKYFNFFTASTVAMFNAVGFDPSFTTLHIILPVGISFYTFQSMAYTIDVYRRRQIACNDLVLFALYVSYFPQLVAGPIERASRLLPQLNQNRHVTWTHIHQGSFLILFGLFKKIAIADSLAPFATTVFQYPSEMDGRTLLFGLYFFTIQIYCDFSGYSDIARGTSKLLGINLMENFNQPYFSKSITEFWRRWHISLSSWLRDYLYVPLGGNRRGKYITYRNLFLTMLLGGLWHGASWTFVVWGAIHGVYLSIHRSLGERLPGRHAESTVVRIADVSIRVVFVFHLVAFAWIFFRAETFGDAWSYITGLLQWQPGDDFIGKRDIVGFVSLVALLFAVDLHQFRTRDHVALLTSPWYFRGVLCGLMLVCILSSGGLSARVPFIYFQF